jgi:hypothetical protein
MKFAKIFESDKYGQIAAINYEEENGNPAIQLFFKPKILGVCKLSISFPDTNNGLDKCDQSFNSLTVELAEDAIEGVCEEFRE